MLIINQKEELTIKRETKKNQTGEPNPIPPLVVAKLNEIAKLKAWYLNGGWCDEYP